MKLALALIVLVATVALAAPGAAGPDSATLPAVSVTDVPIFAGMAPGLRGRRARAHEEAEAEPTLVPDPRALRAARRYATDRGGAVSFATVDSRGHLQGSDEDRLYSAASVVKAMVLAAELRRLADAGAEIDEGTDSLLTSMITYSDNEAADAVYARVGDPGLLAVAKRAGMTGFRIYGHWGNAQITARDMAVFFADLDDAFPKRFRDYAKGLLASVIASQSWGIPKAAGERWGVRFKGGWLPDHALVHQAAELRERGGPRRISIAILTDEQPSFGYGVQTLEGIAGRLLEERPAR
jgi:hypothetical protein